jgi:hypothetical protein
MHAVEIQTDSSAAGDHAELRYRWRCCCGKVGPWRSGTEATLYAAPAATIPADAAAWHASRVAARAARSARRGGQRHVAAMERG